MTTTPFAQRWTGLVGVLLLLLAPSALAQDAEPDRDDKTTIIIELDDDGDRRVVVNGEELDDDEAEAYLKEWREEWGPRVYVRSPGKDRTFFFRHGFDDDPAFHFKGMMDEPVVFDLEGFPHEGVMMDRLVEGLHGGLGRSMEERAEIARMDAASRRLAREARRAEGAERDRLEQELQEKLNEIFEKKQALRAERIERLRSELEEAEAEQAERQELRQEIIDRRLKELLGERDKYDW